MTPARMRKIEELYRAARDHEPLARQAFLAEACEGDEDLRLAVESLLAQDTASLPEPRAEGQAGFPDDETEMQLAAGTLLGPYRIEEPLGAGGMGQVYKAQDTRLGRSVAIKVAHERFSSRFAREAKTISSLNHPHICTLYDVGPNYLVMELVEGETLAAILRKRPLSIDLALRYGRQIAEALSEAHSKEITHRDLKPGNIMIAKSGAKVLDFGLAKSSADETLTASRMAMGTPAYMAPEQFEGKECDARSDIFSLGLVLYEMATGKRAFSGPSHAALMANVLRCERPPLEGLPDRLAHVIERCLSREPETRWQSATDLKLELEWAGERITGSTAAEVASPPPARRWLWPAIAASSAALLLTAIALIGAGRQQPQGSQLRLTPFSFEAGGQCDPVWSPDGKAVAFAARQKITDPVQVYVRDLDSPVAAQITRIPEPAFPRGWTMAGRIVFQTLRKPGGLWSISQVGGEAEPLVPFQEGMAYGPPAISRDGTAAALTHVENSRFGVWISAPPGAPAKIYEPAPFAAPASLVTPLLRFSRDGKQILLMRDVGKGMESWLLPYPPDASHPPRPVLHNLPNVNVAGFSWMPDNRHVVVSASTAPAAPQQLYLADTLSGEFALLAASTMAQVTPDVSPDGGKVVFSQRAIDLDIVSVDLTKLDPARPELASAAVAPLIATQRAEQMPAWASQEAALVYVTDRTGDSEIWLHRPGQLDRPVVRARDFPEGASSFSGPALSPDATRLIYRRSGPGRKGLWISAVAGGSPVPLVKGDTDGGYPGSWSPDGSRFVYFDLQQGHVTLNQVRTTGQAEPEILDAEVQGTVGYNNASTPLWSPAGDWILYFENGFKLISPDGKTSREVVPRIALTYVFSPDGKTLYGMGRMGGRLQIFSVPVAGGPPRVLGSLGLEYFPFFQELLSLRLTFAPDGNSITYSTGKTSDTLWLMEGLTTPRHGLLERLGLR